MSRAALTFTKALERQAQQADKTSVEAQSIKAATLGLGDSALDLIQKINGGGAAFASLGAKGTAAFNAISASADQTAAKTNTLLSTMLEKIREVNSQAASLKTEAGAQNASGSLTDDGLKVRLQQINAVRDATLKELNAEYALDAAAQKLAATETAAAETRRAAAQKIIDQQNGLTATYRAQLAVLRELRDAGNLSPAQFKQAGTELVNKQPVVQANTAAQAAADQAAKAAAANALAVAQAGSATATASAQAQVYAAFLIAQAAASEQAAQAEARQAEITQAVAAASARSQAAQQAQYATKTAFIAKLTEEADALFRTKEAQIALDAQRAGVSSAQAQQLAKLSVDRDFIASIYTEISSQERLRDQFGLTTAEILRQEAAQRNLTNTTASAISRFEALANANKSVADQAARSKAADAFVASTNQLGAGINTDGTQKSRSELLALKAAELGVVDQTKDAIEKLALLDGKTGQLGKNVFATRNQLLTLKYTLSDVVASAASGISPLTILLQQGGQVAQVEGGIGGIFRTITSLITPARVALGGLAAAVAGVGYAFYEGSKQSKDFADSLILTGGFAGKTEGQFNELAKAVSASGQVTVGAARDFAQALIGTGQVGPQVLEAATAAAAKYGQATGQDAKAVAQDFASMGQDVVKWATEHNRQLHLVSAAQYDQIKALQESGRSADAQAIVYDALDKRFSHLNDNLGTLGRALQGTKNLWSSFWNAAFDIGRAETIEDRIKKASDAADALNNRLRDGRAANPAFSSAPPLRENDASERARIGVLAGQKTDESVELKRLKIAQDNAAANIADRQAVTDRAIAGKSLIDQYAKEGKSADLYREKLKALTQSFKDNADAGTPVSPERQAAALAGLKKQFTNNSTSAQSEADQQRKANLDKDLKGYEAYLAKQQDDLKFSQQELSAIYAASNISLNDYFDRREQITADGVKAELDTQEKAQQRLQQELDAGKFKDPHERTQTETQLQESIAKTANIERDAAHAARLAALDRVAIEKQLTDRVSEYRAQLLQSEGDEEGAARIRAEQAIKTAQLFSKQSGGLVSADDIARQARAIEQANALAEVQRKVGVATADAARAEDLYLLIANRGGASQVQQDQAVYAIRATLVEQLGVAAQRTKELADAEIAASAAAGRIADPKILSAAADATLAYVKALDAMDPALGRLRDAVKSTADSIADSIGSALNNFKGFKDLLNNIGQTILQASTKLLVTDPLKVELENVFKSVSEGDNPLANLLKKVTGVGGPGASGSTNAQTSQTAALTTSTTALAQFTAAANAAAAALGGKSGVAVPAGATGALFDKYKGTSTNPSDANYENESDKQDSAARLATNYADAAAKTQAGSTAFDAATNTLVSAAGKAGSAFGPLPGLLAQFAASLISTAATNSLGGAGGIGGFFSKLFGGGGTGSGGATAGASSSDLQALYGSVGYGHTGGFAGSLATRGVVNMSVFNAAPRYHEGAMVGASAAAKGSAPAIASLKANEVPAVLMGGPKGTREEVLHASDPRHADNISPAVLNLIRSIGQASRTSIKTLPASIFTGARRYHTGSVVGMDERPTVMRSGGARNTENWSGQGGSSRPMVFNNYQSFAPDTTQKTTDQAAVQAGRQFARAQSRGAA